MVVKSSTRKSIGFRPVRISNKEVSIPVIIEGVDDHLEVVLGTPAEIALHPTGQNLLRFPVVSPESDIERIAIEEDCYFGPFGDRQSKIKFPLGEIRYMRSLAPRTLIESTVDPDDLLDFKSRDC